MMAPEQVAIVTELNRSFANQGTLLVVVPVPTRAAVRPEVLYLADPKQAAYSPELLVAHYDNYIKALEQQGVAAVNVLAEAIAFDTSGGQTFFKRDLHWTPEGANMTAKVVAAKIRERLKKPLPQTPFTLTRNPNDKTYSGLFINHWVNSMCSYTFPPEPLGDYSVSRASESAQPAKVVQAGSSFGGSPFDKGFLSAALQSEVANRSVGNGGVFLGLENYLASRDYQRERPTVLVWEFPASAQAIGPFSRRRLLAGTYGICSGATTQFERIVQVDDAAFRFDKPLNITKTYLTVSFSDLTLLNFKAKLRYSSNLEETIEFNRPEQIAKKNQGRFFTTLADSAELLEEISLEIPAEKTGTVTLQLCQVP